MKSLGVLLCAALMLVPLTGSTAPTQPNPYLLEALAMNEAITGDVIDVSNAELLASEEFTLPAGALGVQATYDAASDVLTVVPISAMPDTSGESGCVLANSFAGFGYTVSPVAAGDYYSGCPYPGGFNHPGGPDTETLVCINTQYCVVFSYGYDFNGGFNYRYLYLYCQFNTVTISTVSQGAPPSTLGTGFCQSFGFSFGGNPAASYGYVYSYPPSGTTAGLINW